MISVRFTMTSGVRHEFINVQSTINELSDSCYEGATIMMLGGNGKTVSIFGPHVESIEEL